MGLRHNVGATLELVIVLALAALSSSGVAMMLFYLVAYMFRNMGAFLVVEAVARSERSDRIDAYRGLAQRSPLLALAMLIFLLSLGGIPFVAGFWAAIERGLYGLVFFGAVLTVVAPYYYPTTTWSWRGECTSKSQNARPRRDRRLPRRRGRHGRVPRLVGDHGHAERGDAVLGGSGPVGKNMTRLTCGTPMRAGVVWGAAGPNPHPPTTGFPILVKPA